ncbi:MAG: molybdopterin-dependent oxidoreductase [Caldilineaceae bacterium]
MGFRLQPGSIDRAADAPRSGLRTGHHRADLWEVPAVSPLKRRSMDDFVPVSWEMALDVVAERLASTVAAHGPDAVIGVGVGALHQRGNYLFQKFFRRDRHQQHRSLLPACATPAPSPGWAIFFWQRRHDQLDPRDPLRRLHPDHRLQHVGIAPGDQLRSGARREGRRIVDVIDPRCIGMVDHATLWLQPTPGPTFSSFGDGTT